MLFCGDGELGGRGFDTALCLELLDNFRFDGFSNSFSDYGPGMLDTGVH